MRSASPRPTQATSASRQPARTDSSYAVELSVSVFWWAAAGADAAARDDDDEDEDEAAAPAPAPAAARAPISDTRANEEEESAAARSAVQEEVGPSLEGAPGGGCGGLRLRGAEESASRSICMSSATFAALSTTPAGSFMWRISESIDTSRSTASTANTHERPATSTFTSPSGYSLRTRPTFPTAARIASTHSPTSERELVNTRRRRFLFLFRENYTTAPKTFKH